MDLIHRSGLPRVSLLFAAVSVLGGCATSELGEAADADAAARAQREALQAREAALAETMSNLREMEAIRAAAAAAAAAAAQDRAPVAPVPPPVAPAASPAASPSSPPPGISRLVAVTPLTSTTDFWGDRTADGTMFSGSYTRLVITSQLAEARRPDAGGAGDDAKGKAIPGDVVPLQYESRGWLARALVGKEFNLALSVKLRTGESLDLTVPLVAIGHQSNAKGESWTRDLKTTASDFPLFLVRRDGSASTPNITVELKASNTYSSRAAVAGVKAIVDLVKITSADPTVITTLTKDSTSRAAAAIDTALSSLFASSVTETRGDERDLRRWREQGSKQPSGLQVTLKLPDNESDWAPASRIVGTWTITFAPPRPSIFSDWSICVTPPLVSDDSSKAKDYASYRCSSSRDDAEKQVRGEVHDSEILSYRLVRNTPDRTGTIYSYLQQQEWFTAAVASFAQARPPAPSGAAGRSRKDSTLRPFCQHVVNDIVGLGLNDFDARLVLRAVANAAPIALPDLASDGTCKAWLDSVAVAPSVQAVATSAPGSGAGGAAGGTGAQAR